MSLFVIDLSILFYTIPIVFYSVFATIGVMGGENMKVLKSRLLATVFSFFGILILLSGCAKEEIKNAVNWPVADFEYTDQNGKPLSLDDLKGNVWIADFIFTNCETVCPPMTANMARLQKKIKDEGLENVKLVSFSVDPEVDTPEKLKEYASKFTDDQSNWHLLTGYVQKHIEQFAKENFKTQVFKPANDDQVIHGTKFFLVNQKGVIVKTYSGVSDVPYDEIIKDIKILLNN